MKNLVSVVVPTYNQEKILKDCIDGVLSQDLSLIKELIISDDASTDNTRKTINYYHNKFPDLIIPIYRDENLGVRLNTSLAWSKCSGEYIACCAGDDIWIDKNHIAKQVQILEKNVNYIFIGTNAIKWNLKTNEYSLIDKPLPGRPLSPTDYLIGGPIVGSTYMWRNKISKELIDIYNNNGDTRFFMYLAHLGAFYDRQSISTIYRFNESGAFYEQNNSIEKRVNKYIGKIYKNNIFDTYSDGHYNLEIKNKNNILIRRIINNYLRTGNILNALVFFQQYDFSNSNSRKKRFFFKLLKLFLNLFDGFLGKAYNKKFNKIKKSHELKSLLA